MLFLKMVQESRIMTRARIVLETSDLRKSAIVEAADLQGASLTDWFDEQVAAALPHLSNVDVEDLAEISSPNEL